MTNNNCPHCGAVYTGLICDYCGALAGMTATVEQQRQALEELHRMIAANPRDKQILLIKNGYLPDDTAALIDAGLKCISLMDDEEVRSGRSDAAARRLEAVVIKLKLRPPDGEIARSLQLFQERLDKNARSKSRDTKFGLSVFAGLFLAILLLVWYFSRR